MVRIANMCAYEEETIPLFIERLEKDTLEDVLSDLPDDIAIAPFQRDWDW